MSDLDPYRPADHWAMCPYCPSGVAWNDEDGLIGQNCAGCGFEFGSEVRPEGENIAPRGMQGGGADCPPTYEEDPSYYRHVCPADCDCDCQRGADAYSQFTEQAYMAFGVAALERFANGEG